MIIKLAQSNDMQKIAKLDSHIPPQMLAECIENGRVYLLKDDSDVVGILRYSLFWQIIPFLDLIFIEEAYRAQGCGRAMMLEWESAMTLLGYKHVMTSTQADEDAWRFYEKLGYRKVGGFFPPEQEAEELIYLKTLKEMQYQQGGLYDFQ